MIWGRASPKVSQQSDVLPRKPFINSHEALVQNDISLRPAPDPPPSVSVQDMNLEEPLLHQFSGEPQIVESLAISQFTFSREPTGLEASGSTSHSHPSTADIIKGTYVGSLESFLSGIQTDSTLFHLNQMRHACLTTPHHILRL